MNKSQKELLKREVRTYYEAHFEDIKDVARLFKISERTLYHWINTESWEKGKLLKNSEAKAIRTCWDSMDKSDTESISETDSIGNNDKDLIHRVGNINKHKSVLEHLHYSFSINGISRACLQELARHRMASLSVKSTRYTLKELKNVEFHNNPLEMENFFVSNGNNEIDSIVEHALLELQDCLQCGISQDIAKYMLPESYRTSLVWSINARSLQNFLNLRSSKAALKEIQILARLIFENLPTTHKYLFIDSMQKVSE